jgi:hypothetical protein
MRLGCAFLAAVISLHLLHAQQPQAIPKEEIDRSVVSALSRQGVAKAKVVSHIDLTEPFGTVTQWTFVASRMTASHQMNSRTMGQSFCAL